MDAGTLERLIIDRSLCALSPDVEALLAVHLERTPSDAEAAAAFDRTVRLVERATEPPVASDRASAPMPLFRDIERRERLLRWRRRLAAAAGMAAALVFGCILGGQFFGGVARQPGASDGGIARENGGAAAPAQPITAQFFESHSRDRLAPAAGGIWSTGRLLRNVRSAPQDRDGIRLIWESPLRKPRLGEET